LSVSCCRALNFSANAAGIGVWPSLGPESPIAPQCSGSKNADQPQGFAPAVLME
jgi:hypothetical protein